jgi:hypothetical protein
MSDFLRKLLTGNDPMAKSVPIATPANPRPYMDVVEDAVKKADQPRSVRPNTLRIEGGKENLIGGFGRRLSSTDVSHPDAVPQDVGRLLFELATHPDPAIREQISGIWMGMPDEQKLTIVNKIAEEFPNNRRLPDGSLPAELSQHASETIWLLENGGSEEMLKANPARFEQLRKSLAYPEGSDFSEFFERVDPEQMAQEDYGERIPIRHQLPKAPETVGDNIRKDKPEFRSSFENPIKQDAVGFPSKEMAATQMVTHAPFETPFSGKNQAEIEEQLVRMIAAENLPGINVDGISTKVLEREMNRRGIKIPTAQEYLESKGIRVPDTAYLSSQILDTKGGVFQDKGSLKPVLKPASELEDILGPNTRLQNNAVQAWDASNSMHEFGQRPEIDRLRHLVAQLATTGDRNGGIVENIFQLIQKEPKGKGSKALSPYEPGSGIISAEDFADAVISNTGNPLTASGSRAAGGADGPLLEIPGGSAAQVRNALIEAFERRWPTDSGMYTLGDPGVRPATDAPAVGYNAPSAVEDKSTAASRRQARNTLRSVDQDIFSKKPKKTEAEFDDIEPTEGEIQKANRLTEAGQAAQREQIAATDAAIARQLENPKALVNGKYVPLADSPFKNINADPNTPEGKRKLLELIGYRQRPDGTFHLPGKEKHGPLTFGLDDNEVVGNAQESRLPPEYDDFAVDPTQTNKEIDLTAIEGDLQAARLEYEKALEQHPGGEHPEVALAKMNLENKEKAAMDAGLDPKNILPVVKDKDRDISGVKAAVGDVIAKQQAKKEATPATPTEKLPVDVTKPTEGEGKRTRSKAIKKLSDDELEAEAKDPNTNKRRLNSILKEQERRAAEKGKQAEGTDTAGKTSPEAKPEADAKTEPDVGKDDKTVIESGGKEERLPDAEGEKKVDEAAEEQRPETPEGQAEKKAENRTVLSKGYDAAKAAGRRLGDAAVGTGRHVWDKKGRYGLGAAALAGLGYAMSGGGGDGGNVSFADSGDDGEGSLPPVPSMVPREDNIAVSEKPEAEAEVSTPEQVPVTNETAEEEVVLTPSERLLQRINSSRRLRPQTMQRKVFHHV